MTAPELYVGLLSGTSADAIDAALVDFAGPSPRLLACHNLALDDSMRQEIHALAQPGDNEIDRLGVLDQQLAVLFARATQALLQQAGVHPSEVRAIGSHGQTLRHRPPNTHEIPFSLQVGDANRIAHITGITTITDFRRRDMAAGGQGAPLMPAFHRAAFHSVEEDRVLVNIGGMANVTWLPRGGTALGFDTGPGNALLDAWIRQQRGLAYDEDGRWASTGRVHGALLERLLSHPYFQETPPKSTGPEVFNLHWLQAERQALDTPITPEDIQATLLALTARSISDAISAMEDSPAIYLCGGGAHNSALVAALRELLPEQKLASTEVLGVHPDWVEAAGFAWLARQTLGGLSGNLPAVTGAEREVILGGIYPA